MPEAQTCCGQPAYNSGDRADTVEIAKQVIEAFEGYRLRRRAIGIMRRHAEEALSGTVREAIPPGSSGPLAFSARVHELVSFLTDVRGIKAVDASLQGNGYLSRFLLGPARTRRHSASRGSCSPPLSGLELAEMKGADVCCGFGGTFCVKYPDISNSIVTDKTAAIKETRRRPAAGRRPRLPDEHGRQAEARGQQREGAPCRRSAGRNDRHARRSGKAAEWSRSPPPPSRTMPPRRSSTRSCKRRMRHVKSNFIDKRAKAAADAAGIRRAARQRPGHQGPCPRQSRPLSRSLRAEGDGVWRACALGADAEEARGIVLDICRKADAKTVTKGKSMITEEIGAQRFPGKQRHHAGRDRPWRIHHPAARRASEPHHRAGRASQQGPGARGFPQGAHASAGRPADVASRKACCWRRAACCAKSSSRPMSASPAPTS